MKQGIILLSTILIILLLSTCYYDSEEYLFPQVNNQCDTTSFTFSTDVKPILENNCYSCHSNSSASLGGGIKLEDYADVKVQASNGHLMGSIEHSSGFSPMPQGTAKLDDCKITIIRKWIDAGMLNN
jgi:hypothetical protein